MQLFEKAAPAIVFRLWPFTISLLVMLTVFMVRLSQASQPYEVPRGSYVLEYDGQTGEAILGSVKNTQLIFLNMKSTLKRVEDVPIVPRVALRIGDAGILAVFGHGRQKAPSSKFLLVQNGHWSVHELEEPVSVVHGLVWNTHGGSKVILGDQGSRTLVFINVGHILRAARKAGIRIPIGRLVVEDEPFDLELVSEGHLALSFVNREYFEIYDLNELYQVDRIRQRGFNAKLSIAALKTKKDSGLILVLKDYNKGIDVFSTVRKGVRGIEFLGSRRVEPDIADFYQSRSKTDLPAVFQAIDEDDTIWLGYRGWLFTYRLSQSGRAEDLPLDLVNSKKLSLAQIDSLHFIDSGSHALISSSMEGMVLLVPAKELLAPSPPKSFRVVP